MPPRVPCSVGTLFFGLSIPKSVQVCSTKASYSLNEPGSRRSPTRSLEVSRPYGELGGESFANDSAWISLDVCTVV